jgi:hypothetical protein
MTMQNDDFEDFSYEVEDETPVSEADTPEIEIEDDTPEVDRGREPMPKELVEELEADELEDYSDKVKTRLKQMKKVWHDERREKEREMREKTEALSVAQRILEENRRLKSTIAQGEQSLVGSYKQTADFELSEARREYRDAVEAGDTERQLDAHEKLTSAQYKLRQLENYVPALQEEHNEVEIPQQQVQTPQPDQKTMAWQERNTWYGTDPEMTASALGLHQRLINERGPQFAGTDEYWGVVDKTIRRRFSEYFGDEMDTGDTRPAAREQKASSVVAPASRTRSPKKIVLKQSQLAIAKRLGLAAEQYARELVKMEK